MKSFALWAAVLMAASGASGGAARGGTTPGADAVTGQGGATESDADKLKRLEMENAALNRRIVGYEEVQKAADAAMDRKTEEQDQRDIALQQREAALNAREEAAAGSAAAATAGMGGGVGVGAKTKKPVYDQVENTAVRIIKRSFIDGALREPGDVVPNYTGGLGDNLETGRINSKGKFVPDSKDDDD